MDKKRNYKWCFVPQCLNTSIKKPEKKFFTVPKDVKRRKAWFRAIRRDMPESSSNFFCCEDHFNLQDDVENYYYFSTMGGPIKFKSSVVPHIFDSQLDRKCSSTITARQLAEKRRRFQEVNDVLKENETQILLETTDNEDISLTNPIKIINILSEDSANDNFQRSIDNSVKISSKKSKSSHKENITYKNKKIQANIKQIHCNKYIMCKISPLVKDVDCSTINFENETIHPDSVGHHKKLVQIITPSASQSEVSSIGTISKSRVSSVGTENCSENVPSNNKDLSDSNNKLASKTGKNLRQEFKKQLLKVTPVKPQDSTCIGVQSEWPYIQSLFFLKNQFPSWMVSHNTSTPGAFSFVNIDTEHKEQDEESHIFEDPISTTENMNQYNIPVFYESERSTVSTSSDYKRRIGYDDRKTGAAVAQTLIEKEEPLVKNQRVECNINDEDVGFFNSLLPHVRSMTPRQKMMFRIKIQQMAFDIVYESQEFVDKN